MSTFQYLPLRDTPHEFLITIGGGVKLKRVWWEEVIHPLRYIYGECARHTDLELFFGCDKRWKELTEMGVSLMHHIHFPDINTTMEDIAVALQQLPSKSQARKNGWSGPVETGYSQFKRKFHRFYILKLDTDMRRRLL